MSYQERRAIVSLLSTILIAVGYAALMGPRYPQVNAYAPEVFRFWGVYFLILIPVTIVARVLITVAFIVVNTVLTHEMEPEITDERDRHIELRANSLTAYLVGGGFMLAMAALVAGLPPAAMFVILICAGVTAELLSDIARFYFYRRGV